MRSMEGEMELTIGGGGASAASFRFGSVKWCWELLDFGMMVKLSLSIEWVH